MSDSHPLRSYLAERRIADKDFARDLGISAPLLSLIISGRRRVTLDLSLTIERKTEGAVTCEMLAAAYQPEAAE